MRSCVLAAGTPNSTARAFASFEAADLADVEYYASLTPEKCLDIQLDIIAAYREATVAQTFERVCRVIKLEES